MKGCGVAGSSVVLKSEFTTHTKENTFGEESYTKTITTQNEGTYDTIDSTKLPSIIAIINDLPFLLLVYQQGDISHIAKYPLVITNHQIQF